PSLIFLRFLHGIASAMTLAASQAYIGEISPKGREGSVMGLFTTCALAGLCLGPIIGGVVSDHLNIRTAFICMGVLTFISAAVAVFMLPVSKNETSGFRKNKNLPWNLLLKDNDISAYCFLRFSYAAAIGVICSFLPIFAVSELNINHASIGVLIMIGVLVSGILNTPMGILADKVNRRSMVISGGMVSAFSVMAYFWADNFSGVFAAGFLFGLGGGIAMPALMALAIDKGKNRSAIGSVTGLLAMSHSFGMMTGAFCGGFIMEMLGVRYIFVFSGLLLLTGVFTFANNAFHRSSRIKTQNAIAVGRLI
ncbi:MAG: MFS transporter, partial [bacterium]|nr:MFS transporter [bacterium]